MLFSKLKPWLWIISLTACSMAIGIAVLHHLGSLGERILAIFALSEIGWVTGACLVLVSVGVNIFRNWRVILLQGLEKVRAKKSVGVTSGFIINRIAAIAPYLYIAAMHRQLGWFVSGLAGLEIILSSLNSIVLARQLGLLPESSKIVVRPAVASDLPGILAVDAEAWGSVCPANEGMFISRMNAYPEGGVVVAEVESEIVAFVSTQCISMTSDQLRASHDLSWDSLTDNGTIAGTHDPLGVSIYGVGLAATSKGGKFNAVSHLMLFVARQAIAGRKKEIFLIARVPYFARHHSKKGTPIESYVTLQRNGRPLDSELAMYSQYGVRVVTPPVLIHDYMGPGSDPDSGGWSVLVRWSNPFYRFKYSAFWAKVFSIPV